MESKIEKETNPLNESDEIRKKAREELNRQLQGLLNDQPIEKLTDDNIEDEVNRLMEEVDLYEKNYVPKEVDENEFNELKKFEEEFGQVDIDDENENEDDEKEEKEDSNSINMSNTNNIVDNNNNEIIDTSSKNINKKKEKDNKKKKDINKKEKKKLNLI